MNPPGTLSAADDASPTLRAGMHRQGSMFLYALMGAPTTLHVASIPNIWVSQGGVLRVRAGQLSVTAPAVYVAPHVPHTLDGQGGLMHGLSLCESLASANPDAPPVRALSARELNLFTDYFDRLDVSDAQELASRLHLPPVRLSGGVRALIEQMQSAPMLRMSQSQAVDLMGMERTALLKRFRQETGMTFRRYKNWVGMQRAMQLVVAGRSASDAALEGGFADLGHFSRHCRASTGYSPRQGLHYFRQAAALVER